MIEPQTFKAEKRALAAPHNFERTAWFVCAEPQTREDGHAKVITVGFPVLAITGFVEDPEGLARKLAMLLTVQAGGAPQS